MRQREKAPICTVCGGPMHLVRAIPQCGGLPELLTFQCKICKTVTTEPAQAGSEIDTSHHGLDVRLS